MFSQSELICNLADLRKMHASFPRFVRDFRATHSVSETFAELSLRHRYIHAAVLRIAQNRLTEDGFTASQAPYAFLILGSGARDEQSIVSDQDHALIYEAVTDRCDAYFSRLAEVTAALLHEVGYPLCDGNVMASNARWRGSREMWQERLRLYAETPNWDNIRFLLIAADARAVCGHPPLARAIQAEAVQAVARSAFIKWKIADVGLAQRVSLTLLGHVRVETNGEYKGRFSIKEGLYTPLVSCVRVWALSMGLEDTGTQDRIHGLIRARAWNEALAESVLAALQVALEVRLNHHLLLAESGQPVHDYVLPETLSPELGLELKRAFRTVRQLQLLTARHFPRGG